MSAAPLRSRCGATRRRAFSCGRSSGGPPPAPQPATTSSALAPTPRARAPAHDADTPFSGRIPCVGRPPERAVPAHSSPLRRSKRAFLSGLAGFLGQERVKNGLHAVDLSLLDLPPGFEHLRQRVARQGVGRLAWSGLSRLLRALLQQRAEQGPEQAAAI